jgi:hypothetical protein
MTRFLCFLLLVVASHAVLSGEMTLEGSRRHLQELPGDMLRPRPETALRSGEGVEAPRRLEPRLHVAVPTPAELPPPLYDSVLELELAQQADSERLCPADRLVVVAGLGPGFDSLLLTLQAGLTIGALRFLCVARQHQPVSRTIQCTSEGLE